VRAAVEPWRAGGAFNGLCRGDRDRRLWGERLAEDSPQHWRSAEGCVEFLLSCILALQVFDYAWSMVLAGDPACKGFERGGHSLHGAYLPIRQPGE
jgi:hypothetical protein